MHTCQPAASAPLPGFARAAGFAILAIVAIGVAQFWLHDRTDAAAEPAVTAVDAHQPLVAAPSAADMWRL